MIRRTHLQPFLHEEDGGRLRVDFLEDPEGRVAGFLDRLCGLVGRLEGRPRRVVAEVLRRQERRIRDVRRLDGISKTLLDHCVFRPPPGAERSQEVRNALFDARGRRWPPVPGDERVPYREAAEALDTAVEEVDRLLYADEPGSQVMARAPRLDGRRLLARYNLDLARAVLLDAEQVVVTARGGWKAIFRSVKLARLMYRLERAGGRRHRLEITGPASAFVTRSRRYGSRFVRIVPAVVRAPGWHLHATVLRDERRLAYELRSGAPFAGWQRPGRPNRYDSAWERDLAREFREKLGESRAGWTLRREESPVAAAGELFLPDFTFRHRDGRTALVEVVGFWTPRYLEDKVRKVRAARLDNLVLVVYRGLATGDSAEAVAALEEGPGTVVWFGNRPRIGAVMEAVERVATREG